MESPFQTEETATIKGTGQSMLEVGVTNAGKTEKIVHTSREVNRI